MNKIVFASLLSASLSASNPSRTVEVRYNPDCTIDECLKPDENNSTYNLVHVKATGPKDEIHFMYSSIRSFSIMVFRTNINTNVAVNWTNLLSKDSTLVYDSIKFSETPLETSGYSFPSIYEFDDRKGDADMTKIPNNKTYWEKYLTADIIWSPFKQNVSNCIGIFEGKLSQSSNGSVKFVIKYPGKDKRDEDLPHLLLNPDSSAVDFVLDSLEPKFNDSKFGVTIELMSMNDLFDLASKSTLDDEYTPGTFKLWNLEVSNKTSKAVSNFLQWKPIFYFFSERTLENSTITKQYTLEKSNLSNGIGSVFFNPNTVNVKAVNVSFGLEGNEKDGYYYKQTKYSVWSFSIGMGAAPVEKMSFVVTIVIIVGFGLPALVILVGLLVMVVKKIKNSRNSEYNEL